MPKETIERRKTNKGGRRRKSDVYPDHGHEHYKEWISSAINQILERFQIDIYEFKEYVDELAENHGQTD
jgi:hypothetical protein